MRAKHQTNDPKAGPDEAERPDEVPLNRAQRRAHGKGGATRAQPTGTGKISGRTNRSQAPRMWANRRSG
jgi:hypothetical protein